MMGSFLFGTASRIFNISMPTVATSLGTDLVGISWALLAYQLSNVGLSIVFGRFADLWGRDKVFGLGFTAFALASLFCGLSQNLLQLIIARFLQGVAGAMIQASGRAVAAEAVPERIAGRAQGYMTTAFHCGFLLGPSIGGLIIDYLHWRWIFFLLVPIALAGAVLALANRNLRPARRGDKSLDYTGAALLIATTTTLIVVLDRHTLGAFDPHVRGFMGIAFLLCFSGLLIRESRARDPIINLTLFRVRAFTLSTVSLLLASMCYILPSIFLPFYLQETLGLAPSFIGVLFMVQPALTVALAPLSGYLADRVGVKLPTALGTGVLALSLFSGALLRADSHWWLPTLMMGLIGATQGLFNPANSLAFIKAVPKGEMGFASAAHHVAFTLGGILGIAIGNSFMTLAFEHQAQAGGGVFTTQDPVVFVAALNATFLAATPLSLFALLACAWRAEPPTGDNERL